MISVHGKPSRITIMPLPETPVQRILCEVSESYDIPLASLLSRSRVPQIAWARQIAYVRLRDDLCMSYPAIGAAMGRDHTTIMHGVEAMRRRIKEGLIE